MAATASAIAQTFLESEGMTWWVDGDTYINNVPLTIDNDYYMGYLLEVVERSTSALSYMVVVLTPRGMDTEWYPENAGRFFDRTEHAAPHRVQTWAVGKINGLFDHADSLRPSRKGQGWR